MNGQGWTVKQAAKALGQSEKTIRRRIKKGEIRAEQVSGKYGVEYRIKDINIISNPKSNRDIMTGSDTMVNVQGMTRGDTGVEVLELTRDDAMVKALDMIRELQLEIGKLAAHIGFLQAQLRETQDKMRLLTAPKKPWWRRLMWWKGT